MIRKRRPLVTLVFVSLIALIGAGCGSNTSARTATGSSGGGDPVASNARKAVKFAECMRNNGVSAFPDPKASGKLTIDAVANGSSVNASAPTFKHAISVCKDLEPAGFTGSKRSSQQQSAALRFAQCVRANGVPDFPDPVNGQPLIDTNRIPSSNSPSGMSILNAATHKCGGMAAAAGVTQ